MVYLHPFVIYYGILLLVLAAVFGANALNNAPLLPCGQGNDISQASRALVLAGLVQIFVISALAISIFVSTLQRNAQVARGARVAYPKVHWVLILLATMAMLGAGACVIEAFMVFAKASCGGVSVRAATDKSQLLTVAAMTCQAVPALVMVHAAYRTASRPRS